jgi:hypothetical protein
MPITPFLAGHQFDPETTRIMGIAFEMTRAALRLADSNDPVMKVVAEKIIEFAQAGERDANGLCEQTLGFFSEQRT